MTNLNPDICRRIKEARREAGLSQSQVAVEVGCKQSALSMFEQGDGTKLNDDVIEKLAAKFNIELPGATIAPKFSGTHSRGSGYCPNPGCPSHVKYVVDGRSLFRINREATDPAGGKFCAICGEVLERKCPNCGLIVHDGAICSFCGEPYVVSGE